MAAERIHGFHPYPYKELPTRTSIRVLELHPANQTRNGWISCTWKVVDLEQNPIYTALSYTWGAPRTVYMAGEDVPSPAQATERNHQIICDGRFIQVTANCYEFLQQIRHVKDTVHQSRRLADATNDLASRKVDNSYSFGPKDMAFFWIDAICINQGSTTERSAQVSIMRTIYRQARSVIVWVGPPDVFSREALEALVSLSNVPEKRAELARTYQMLDTTAYSKLGIPVITETQWQSVYAFLQRSWFSRAWVVQEILQANIASMFCGGLCIPWDCISAAMVTIVTCGWHASLHLHGSGAGLTRLSKFAKYLEESRGPPLDAYKIVQTGQPLATAIVLVGLQDLKYCFGRGLDLQGNRRLPSIPFQAILYCMTHAQATLPEDRVHAFLGVPDEAIWREFDVSYSRPVSETYLRTAWCMMRSSQSIRVLSAVEDKSLRQVEDLPSWVPDFSISCMPVPHDWGSDEPFMGFEPVIFDAAAGMCWGDHSSSEFEKILRVKGLFCSTLGANQETDFSDINSLATLFQFIEDTPSEKFWCTFASTDYRHPDKHLDSFRQHFRSSVESMLFELHWDMLLASRGLPRRAKPFHDADKTYQKATRCYMKFASAYCADDSGDILQLHVETRDLLLAVSKSLDLSYLKEENVSDLSLLVSRIWNPQALKAVFNGTRWMLRNDFFRAQEQIARLSRRRALFRTTDGKLVKGPCSASKGDQVWVLAGAKMPYILRPVDEDEYELVGEAYMCGIMFGEVVRDDTSSVRHISLI